jgi:transposase
MGKPYSQDLRKLMMGRVSLGHSRRSVARHFGVSASCSVKLAQRAAATGSTAPAKQGRPPGTGKLAAHRDTLIGWVEAEPDMTMPELAAKLEAARGVKVHPSALSRLLLGAGFSFKKNAAGTGVRAR